MPVINLLARFLGRRFGTFLFHSGTGFFRGFTSAGTQAVRQAGQRLVSYLPRARNGVTKLFNVTATKLKQRTSVLNAAGLGLALTDLSVHVYQAVTPEDLSEQDRNLVGRNFANLIQSEYAADFRIGLQEAARANNMAPDRMKELIQAITQKLANANPVLKWFFEEATPNTTPSQELLGAAFLLPNQYSDALERIEVNELEKDLLSATSAFVSLSFESTEPTETKSSLKDISEEVNRLEDFLGFRGYTTEGKPRLREFLELLRSLTPEEVQEVYDTKRALGVK